MAPTAKARLVVIAVLLIIAACGEGPAASAISGEEDVARDTSTTSTGSTTSTSTTTASSTTTTPPPTVLFEGTQYTCEEISKNKWDCEDRFSSLVYCNGAFEPTDCSERWYPDELNQVELVSFGGETYACQSFGTRCVTYSHGPPPTNFFSPDAWCDGQTCSYYDPDEWFEVTFEFQDYFCKKTAASIGKFDCALAFGDEPPALVITPDLYCSGSEWLPDCSTKWYPSDLITVEIVVFDGSDYVCRRALGLGSSFNDYDCGLWHGGDPNLVFTDDIKCSHTIGWECSYDDYPSILDRVFFSTIGGVQHVCEDTIAGSECYGYFGGSIAMAMSGLPDYYCNRYGECGAFGYP